jgi:lipid-A-disaccharide synthase
MSSAASSAEADLRAGTAAGRPRIALVAGEASGDQLGAALIEALLERLPNARFMGVGGPKMAAAGMECWKPSDELAVMGLFEVLRHLPRLIRLRRWLLARLLAERPDLLVGIDSPDFNLGLERRAREAGIATAHYVSPTVWAWRRGRVRTIARSTDRVLCLFPFEPAFYAEHGVAAEYTGDPLADAIDGQQSADQARRQLGLEPGGPCIALLPGSRRGEVERLARPLLDSAQRLQALYPSAHFVAPMANPALRALFEDHARKHPGLRITLLDGQSTMAMAAADVVVCASGTAALEAMLVNRPMVVVYRLSWMTYLVGKAFRLVKARFTSLPNVLANQALVPELLQHEVSPERIADEVRAWIENPQSVQALREAFSRQHQQLRRDAARSAAEVIHALIDGRVQ